MNDLHFFFLVYPPYLIFLSLLVYNFNNLGTRRFIEGEIPLISVHLRELAAPTPQFQHEYHVIVGIHSNEFRRLITYLGHIGVLGTLSV